MSAGAAFTLLVIVLALIVSFGFAASANNASRRE